MDNSEDNCVENKQLLENQVPQWIETWSKYILTQYSTASEPNAEAMVIAQEILLAITQGDSCISAKGRDTSSFQSLMIKDTQINRLDDHAQVAPFVEDDQFLYLYRYWQLEQRLAIQVTRLKQQKIESVDISKNSDLLEEEQQKKALAMVAERAFSIITGGPGTGKTYTLARIIAVLNQANPNIRIAMAAPTGKAAQRMGEALQNSLTDEKLKPFNLNPKLFNPMTLHRLLGLGNQKIPRFNVRQPLPYDVIVIDEASMLDLNLATLLFEAVPNHCRLILLGDANQLASVDVGSVLADLQQVEALQVNCINLVKSRRFSDDALIGKMAKFIQAQKMSKTEHLNTDPLLMQFEKNIVPANELQNINLNTIEKDLIQLEYLPDDVKDLDVTDYYQKLSLGFQGYFQSIGTYLKAVDDTNDLVNIVTKAFDEYRILTAVRHGALGLRSLNQEMEKALFTYLPTLFRQGDWYAGRPVMMTYNDYQLGLSNGDIGICLKHREQSDQFEVYFPSLDKWIAATRLPKEIETAFVLTIHKSQGSEFTHTAVVLDQASQKLLSQELLYTAITRAKKAVSLLVDKKSFVQSLSVETSRLSGLVNKIKEVN